MSDSKWTALGALATAASVVGQSLVERRKPPSNDPGLHERLAVLEEKVRRLEEDSASNT